jgi:hypothetical protein
MKKCVVHLSLVAGCLSVLFACQSPAQLVSSPVTEVEQIDIQFAQPKHIVFQGKGAGAGIALMSTMGPMGIALGVAIDEGIAKDIRTQAVEQQFDIDAMILAGFSAAANITHEKQMVHKTYSARIINPVAPMPTEAVNELVGNQVAVANTGALEMAETDSRVSTVMIKRFGYKTVAGENDASCAELVIQWQDADGTPQQINYPADFDHCASQPLALLRQDGTVSTRLMAEAVQAVWQRYFSLANKSPI